MIKKPDTNAQRMKRHQRVRAKVSGTPERPRLNVFRSKNNIYAQVIDDVAGNTLVAASTLDKEIEGNGGNKDAARAVGRGGTSAGRSAALFHGPRRPSGHRRGGGAL